MIRQFLKDPEDTEELSTHFPDWRTASDPHQATWLYSQDIIKKSVEAKSLCLSMDIRKSRAEQDQALVTFYKRENVDWASPLHCKLRGDAAIGTGVERHMISTVIFRLMSGFHINLGKVVITKIFEGEPDHLVPSLAEELLENKMFAVAGRMIGHSILLGGPSFPGLSPAIIPILCGGSSETTPVTIQDCPDLDIRDIIQMVNMKNNEAYISLDGDGQLEDFVSIDQLCLSWDLPGPNATNRKWLAKQLLFLTVIEQTRLQINQFEEGLRETGLWPLLIHRRDVIPILFPRESEAQITPQINNKSLLTEIILNCIIWPTNISFIYEQGIISDDEEQDESNLADVGRISAYLKRFIENASSADLKSLIKFWIGWEVPATEMIVDIIEAKLPTASTCFQKLRLPRHYTAYKKFHEDLCACISTTDSGFGCA